MKEYASLAENSAKDAKKKDNSLESAVEAVVVQGAWSVLQDHLGHYPQIMKQLNVTKLVSH